MSLLAEPLVKVVGDRTAKALKKAFDMESVEDLLRHYPRRYAERGQLTDLSSLRIGEEVTVLARVETVASRPLRQRKGSILDVVVSDGTASLSLTFFNQAWRERDLKPGVVGLFAGTVGDFRGKRQLAHPDYELVPDDVDAEGIAREFAGALIPVYPATAKLASWRIATAVHTVLDLIDGIEDPLPEEVRTRHRLPGLDEAFRRVHLPQTRAEAESARHRLAWDEAFTLQALLAQRRIERAAQNATPRLVRSGGLLEAFDAALPFDLTRGQREVSAEIEGDLAADHPMHRLLQGEVGSGKTVVALRAMLAVIDAGGQAALLAPTEVLAQQHHRSISTLLGSLAMRDMLGGSEIGTKIALLTGSQSTPVRRQMLLDIADGSAGIVIGTHALIQENVSFFDLGLVVVDEQHRFGVEQRDALRAKAKTPPHLLVMTATPIPRTVAMTVFGDLDVSTLRELPAGRSPISTHVIAVDEQPHFLARAWQRILEEVGKGHQAYVVAPKIGGQEENAAEVDSIDDDGEVQSIADALPRASVLSLMEELSKGPLASVRLGMLHGRMAADDKDETMRAFAAGQLDVLVATTVIEVGVDVPNASTMVIMDADRFGVSQLHQLRGRVGRGSVPGLCLLVTHAPADSSARERLVAVAATLDGFELSQIDLEQRREGDVLGTAQSGVRSHLRILRVLRDEELILTAREEARTIVGEDPTLSSHPLLARELERLNQMQQAEYAEKA
jgi:ATP-dependent DNA helicase RecG